MKFRLHRLCPYCVDSKTAKSKVFPEVAKFRGRRSLLRYVLVENWSQRK